MHRRIATSVLALALVTVAVPTAAQAQQSARRGVDGVRFDAHLDVGAYGHLGIGFRVDIPIVPDGFLSGSTPDDLCLSPGGELFWIGGARGYGDDFSAMPVVAAQWNIYLSDSWSIFPEAGLAVVLGEFGHHQHRHRFYTDHSHVWLDPWLGFGARYHFGGRIALLMRIAWPAMFQIGLTF